MSTDDAPQTGRSFLWVLATGAMTMAAVIVLGIVAVSMASLGKPSDSNTPPVYSASDWSERSLGDVVIEAPFALALVPDIQAKLPLEVRGNVEFTEVFQSPGTSPAFSVVVTRAGYKPSLVVDLNRAVLSSIKNVAAGFDDRSPGYKTTSIEVGSGCDEVSSGKTRIGFWQLLMNSRDTL